MRVWTCIRSEWRSSIQAQIKRTRSSFYVRLHPDYSNETQGVEQHARCCGGWGRKSPGYPIRRLFAVSFFSCSVSEYFTQDNMSISITNLITTEAQLWPVLSVGSRPCERKIVEIPRTYRPQEWAPTIAIVVT